MQHAALVLVRHGETEGESSIRYHGRNDVALSELGRAQMRAARAAIKRYHGGLRFHRVFASPLVRAAESARIIAGTDESLITIEEFAEVHFGDFEGLTRDEIRDRFPQEYARWRRNPLSPAYTYPGGENRAEFSARVARGLTRILAMWAPECATAPTRAIIVAHRGVIRAVVKALSGAEPLAELGSIQVLTNRGSWSPLALDYVDHLADIPVR